MHSGLCYLSRSLVRRNWQSETLRQAFSLDERKIRILTNAVAPFFHDEPARTSYFFDEKRPPVLYFSSTPFRGLEILCKSFPLVARAIPGLRARIFSSIDGWPGSKQFPPSEKNAAWLLSRRSTTTCRPSTGSASLSTLGMHELGE